MPLNFDVARFSERGPRLENEDSVGYVAFLDGSCSIAPADGLGGHRGGAIASRIAVDVFKEARLAHGSSLREVAEAAHEKIKDAQRADPALRGMATTLSAVVFEGWSARFLHCGDSRIVLQRGRGIRRLTVDHTEGQKLFDAGELTKAELIAYPRKHVLSSALGMTGHPRVDDGIHPISLGDRFFLMSDGVWGKIKLRELAVLSEASESADVFVSLVKRVIEKRGPEDNYSLAAVFCV